MHNLLNERRSFAGEGLLGRGSALSAGTGVDEASARGVPADGSLRASVDGSVRAGGVPLKSAMKGGGGKRPVQKTALQLSAGVRIQEPEQRR